MINQLFDRNMDARKRQERHDHSQGAPKGQGMVEFALILPMLLLLLFGIIEVGRMLVVYSQVQAASREAARYAAAAGDADPVAIGIQPYYADIAGINAAARRVAILSGINTVDVSYDTGPGGGATTVDQIKLKDRVVVRVPADYNPFVGLTPLQPFTIDATTARTIIVCVEVVEDSVGGGPAPGGNAPVVVITSPADNSIYNKGDTITFTATATDAEDGNVGALLEWYVNGVLIGTGPSFTIDTATSNKLSTGHHIIVAQVTDPEGNVGNDSVSIDIFNLEPPTVIIDEPKAGTKFQQNQAITFAGTAVDCKGNDISSDIKWYANSIYLGQGASFTNSSLTTVGPYLIKATVTDADGQYNEASVSIQVIQNEPPVLTIITPGEGSTYSRAQTISFTGEATDAVDGNISYKIVWTSSLDGALGTGATVTRANMTLGTHTITASVTDNNGNTISRTVVMIVVDGQPPSVWIDAPINGQTFKVGDTITFSGGASDPADGNIGGSIVWYSDISGIIGGGTSFSISTLPAGVHTITARVVDSEGLVATAVIGIIVKANTVPVVEITSPIDQGIYDYQSNINFGGTATDVEDGDISYKLIWYSSAVTGTLGAGAFFSYASLPLGVQTITAQAFDAGGMLGSDSVQINVQQTSVCPTGGTLAFSCTGTNCSKLTWKFSTDSTSVLELEYLEVAWTDPNSNGYAVGSASMGGGSPDPISISGSTSPVSSTGSPLWSGAFVLDSGSVYARTLVVNLSDYPKKGDGGVFTVYVRFKGCSTSQASASVPTK